MAKRKKTRKQPASRPAAKNAAEPAAPQTAVDTAPKSAAPQEPERGPEAAGAGRKERPARGVRVSTCVAGMFLTLVLGFYLGTLLPGVFDSRQDSGAERPAPQAAQSQPAPAEAGLRATIAEMERAAAANPDSAPQWVDLGNIYFDAHMPESAIQAYEHALALAPNNADVLTDLGIMYRELGKYEKAVECFRRATSIEPGHQNAMFNEGVVLSTDLHKKEEARAAWLRLMEFNPHAKAPNGTPLSEMIEQLR